MLKRINTYLLTHHPLLWNTRVAWVLAINLIIHVLFFVGGFSSITKETIHNYYGIEEAGGVSLFFFAALCSVVVIIFWLVFYLRNNAFKNWYTLGKWHLAKEYLLILLILFTSCSFYESFFWGMRTKGKSIANKETFAKEANLFNQAMAFVPKDIDNYFILNQCGSKMNVSVSSVTSMPAAVPSDTPVTFENTETYEVDRTDTARLKILAALKQPNAFNYTHYCHNHFSSKIKGFKTEEQNNAEIKKLLLTGRTDTIENTLQQLTTLANKYDVEAGLDINALAQRTLKPITVNSFRPVLNDEYEYINGSRVRNENYFNSYNLNRALEFIDECYYPNYVNTLESFQVIMYVSIALSVLLLCYRRFSKKVFLISFVGAIVLSILISLFGVASQSEDATLWFMLVLFILFTITGVVLVKQKKSKTLAGVSLNWHIYAIPFLAFLIIGLFSVYHNQQYRYDIYGDYYKDEQRQKLNPISYWVDKNAETIIKLNIVFAILYITLVFNRLAKKWHSNPDE